MHGYEARVTDEDGHEVAAGKTGDLWVKGDSICSHYWNQHEKTKATFHGPASGSRRSRSRTLWWGSDPAELRRFLVRHDVSHRPESSLSQLKSQTLEERSGLCSAAVEYFEAENAFFSFLEELENRPTEDSQRDAQLLGLGTTIEEFRDRLDPP